MLLREQHEKNQRGAGRNGNRQPISIRDTWCFRLWIHKSSRTSFTVVHVQLCITPLIRLIAVGTSGLLHPAVQTSCCQRPPCDPPPPRDPDGAHERAQRAARLPSSNISSWYNGAADGRASRWPPWLSSPCICNSAWSLTCVSPACPFVPLWHVQRGSSPPNLFLEHVEDTSLYSGKKDPPFWGGTFSAATSWTGWYLFLILYIYCLFQLLATVCVNPLGLLTIFIVFLFFFWQNQSPPRVFLTLTSQNPPQMVFQILQSQLRLRHLYTQ